MYVCICNNITDKDIKRAVREGAASLACLRERLGVATQCGQCQQFAEAVLEDQQPFTARSSLALSA